MSTFILAAARRASPIISKFGPFRRHFNPIVAAATAIPRFFSSSERVGVAADERMKRVLEAKIRNREDFPYEIDYHPVVARVTVKRNVFGENIEVMAFLPNWCNEVAEGEKDEDDNADDADKLDCDPIYLHFTVNIDKGEKKYLEFEGTSSSKGITIKKIHLQSHQGLKKTVSEDMPKDYSGVLDETLQGAAVKCLEARGIDGSLMEFLLMYHLGKNRQQLDWLKNLKDFVSK